MSLRVSFPGSASDRDDVLHISAKSDGTLVLRTPTGKEYVQPDDYLSYTVTEGR